MSASIAARHTVHHFRCALFAALAAVCLVAPSAVQSQLSLGTAVDLALKADPRVRSAEADVQRARAALSEARAAFIPSVSSSGGFGGSAGVPLSLPVVFNVGAQSLVLNFSQADYIRSAQAGLSAAEFALDQARTDVAADVASTYVELDGALERRRALDETGAIAGRLTSIQNDRFAAGLEPRIEVTRTRRTTAQIRLQALEDDAQIATLSAHLGRVVGLAGPAIATLHASIPAFADPAQTAPPVGESPALRALDAAAVAKDYIARGDRRYNLRPQLTFGANYSRISTVGTNYILYYPGFDPARHPDISYNSLDVGIQVTVPILDWVHRAKARQSLAEASKAHFDAEASRLTFLDGRDKLAASTAQLAARADLASIDRELAQDQLDAVRLQLQPGAAVPEGGHALSPKDEQLAMLEERQRFLDFLAADLELHKTQILLMQRSGALADWVHSAANPASSAAPASNLLLPEAPARR